MDLSILLRQGAGGKKTFCSVVLEFPTALQILSGASELEILFTHIFCEYMNYMTCVSYQTKNCVKGGIRSAIKHLNFHPLPLSMQTKQTKNTHNID